MLELRYQKDFSYQRSESVKHVKLGLGGLNVKRFCYCVKFYKHLYLQRDLLHNLVRWASLMSNSIYDGCMITVFSSLWLAVWLSGNALASINVVALRQTRLVLRWVTVCGRVNHFGM